MTKDTATRLIHTRGRRLAQKTVNPPIERASTLLFDTSSDLYGAKPGYGRMGLAVPVSYTHLTLPTNSRV